MKGMVVETGSFPAHYVVNGVAIGRGSCSFLYYSGDCSIFFLFVCFISLCFFLHRSAKFKSLLWIILYYLGSFLIIHKQKGRAGDDSLYRNACLLVALPQLPDNRHRTSFSSKTPCCSFLCTAKSITLFHVCLPVQEQVTVSKGWFIRGWCKPTSPVPG